MNDENTAQSTDPREFDDSLILGDGDCHILDVRALYAQHDAIASAYIDGCLFLLPRGSKAWVNILDINSDKKSGAVVGIGTRRGPNNTSK
jgi:hypothetical protein